jgi:hypothetical protein
MMRDSIWWIDLIIIIIIIIINWLVDHGIKIKMRLLPGSDGICSSKRLLMW